MNFQSSYLKTYFLTYNYNNAESVLFLLHFNIKIFTNLILYMIKEYER